MEIADTESKRSLGLMFRKEPTDMLFVFEEDIQLPVWTPLMKFPIDVFFLDKNKKVIEVKRGLKPWWIYRPQEKYRYFFESAAGKYIEKKVQSMVKKALN